MSEITRAFREAPACWTTRYISRQGFQCELTLRGEDPIALLKVANDLIAKMAEAGARPALEHEATGQAPAAPTEAGEAPLCPTHNKPMKQSQHGGWYCPVKIADDDGTGKPVYCRQRVK